MAMINRNISDFSQLIMISTFLAEICLPIFKQYFSLVFVMLSRLFIAALWSPKGKGLTSRLLFVVSIVILLLSHLVSWDRCVT